MNERPTLLKPVGPESLADEEDFQVGHISVRPSLREVLSGEAREILEPRVMQVLVVLASAKGAVVSRDELIRRCWGGRIVSEDAINRAVSKVRQLAELGGTKAFEIETIPRVGYRLLRTQPSSPATDHSAARVAVLSSGHKPAAPQAASRFNGGKAALLAAVALTLVVAVVAAAVLIPKPAQEWAVAESHQPFIATPDIERFPSFSPDGTMIAYSRGKNTWSRQIFLQLRRGGDPLQLTHDKFDDVAPAFSPDGTSVAYSAGQLKEPCRIMLAQIPSGPSRQIGHCRMLERTTFSWDRGGRALFFHDTPNAGQPAHIMRLNIDTGAVTEITPASEGGSLIDFQPSASPDGKVLLFFRYLKGDRLQLVLRALVDGSERILIDDDADKYAVWSNDSSTVFVARNEGSDSSLWAYPASGAAPWRITSNARPMEFISAGPDGLLAVELKNKVTQLAVASASDTEAPRPLATDGYSGCSFDYAADGTLVLIGNDGEAPVIVVGTPGHLREVMRLKQRIPCGIHWSPDGMRIAFGGGDAISRISIIDRAGMPVGQVPYPTQDFGYFEWTPDGDGFLETRLDSHGWRVWRVDIASPHRARPILPYGWNWIRMHRGMIVGMKEGSPGIWRIDGTPKRMTDWPSAVRAWTWTMTGDNLVYGDFSNPDRRMIVAQPISGGPRTIVGYANGLDDMSILAVNPTNGRVTYNRVLRDDPDIGWLRVVRK